jgi:hypothetical protein
MIPRDLAAYGGPYQDARPVSDPLTQVASELLNLELNDVAQLTRTPTKVRAMFVTDGTNSPSVVAYGHTLWGTGNTYKPTVARTGVGIFTVTFETSYDDGLDETEETLSLVDADAKQEWLASGFALAELRARAAANVIHVGLFVSGSLADTTGDRITVWGW